MKVNLTESEVRKIVRKVILRNELILEDEAPKGTPLPKKGTPEPATKVEKAKEPPVKKEKKPKEKTKYSDLVSAGNTDNLATQVSGGLTAVSDRSQDIVGTAVTAAGVTYATTALALTLKAGAAGASGLAGSAALTSFGSAALGGVTSGAVLGGGGGAAGVIAGALGPPGWAGLAVVAVGAGLYYMFTPDTIATDALKEALDTTLYRRIATGFTKIYDQMRKSDIPEVKELADKMNPKKCLAASQIEHRKIAQEIYDATQGGMLGLGLGTDEKGIEKALLKCRSYLGVSRVSFSHMKMHEGVIDDGNLLKVFTGELNNTDMELYVNSVIDKLPYIIINEKEYTKEEFQEWLVESKDMVDNMMSDIKKAAEEQPKTSSNTEDLTPPYVQQIQRLINEYCSQKGIEHTPLAEDGKWGPKTTALWKGKYLPHVFANHPVFKTLGLKIGDGKWSGISAQLIGTYPGYTSGEKGCARFCIDALYGNTIKGEEEGGSDKGIRYFGGGSSKRTAPKKEIEPAPQPDRKSEPDAAEKKKSSFTYTPSDGRLTYKNIKIDVDVVGDRSIKKLSQLRGAAADADEELKYDFLTNFGTGRLDLPAGETYQIHITPKKNGKIKLQHKSTKLFKTMGIRTFAAPFHRFFKGLNMSDAEIKRLKIDKSSPIIIKVIMPPGLYNPAVDR